jgi:hypothetical protein
MQVFDRRFAFARTLTAVVAMMLAPAVAAEEPRKGPPRPEAQIAAMAKLDYMVGNWQGTGSMKMGERTVTFRGGELVQKKLDGTVLLVEGSFFSKPPGAEAEVPVHTTLGVISFDAKAGKYRFTTWLANGGSGERELVLLPDGWQWEASNPHGTVRYTMRRGPNGEWVETGERTTDGKTWQPFFEMTLAKP